MKVHLEINQASDEEIVIKVHEDNEEVQFIYEQIKKISSNGSSLLVYDRKKEIMININDIYFFETDDDYVFAHTKDNAYVCKLRLYELSERLPHYFTRISKSTLINLNHIHSIEKRFSSSSLVQFNDCHKEVYISRHYYKNIKEKLNERSFLWEEI